VPAMDTTTMSQPTRPVDWKSSRTDFLWDSPAAPSSANAACETTASVTRAKATTKDLRDDFMSYVPSFQGLPSSLGGCDQLSGPRPRSEIFYLSRRYVELGNFVLRSSKRSFARDAMLRFSLSFVSISESPLKHLYAPKSACSYSSVDSPDCGT